MEAQLGDLELVTLLQTSLSVRNEGAGNNGWKKSRIEITKEINKCANMEEKIFCSNYIEAFLSLDKTSRHENETYYIMTTSSSLLGFTHRICSH